jgi:hypothetical protein
MKFELVMVCVVPWFKGSAITTFTLHHFTTIVARPSLM